jgi:hypothetical protein
MIGKEAELQPKPVSHELGEGAELGSRRHEDDKSILAEPSAVIRGRNQSAVL